MSLEAKIEDLTKAVHALVAALGARPAAAPDWHTPAPTDATQDHPPAARVRRGRG